MDYPRRARKLKKRTPEGNGARDRGELKLAEFPAPRGGEMAWRRRPFNEPVFADDWREERLERGRLH